ncbi:hypothetical protein [Polyangium sorediatum]|uniref:Uncharacterized protein n=1 Tax=Polyangium sorediatum TaxID=889274 RepID=A0ABT6NZQ8_9BACT|nr:hypothetical protein [Polyangium sorediatum]MDI1433840.1 hypothetical protein [Polyangium sorediatum]
MAYRMEDLIRGSMRGGLIFGYVPASAGHLSPAMYKSDLLAEMERMKAAGLVAETCVSSELDDLDEARMAPGITLCGLVPDRVGPQDLERILRCVKSDDRPFFSKRFRADPGKHRKKPPSLAVQQRSSLFELFAEVHQDFVLFISHEPRVADLLRLSVHAVSPLFDYRHHYRILDLS